jgi:hypothetical protein
MSLDKTTANLTCTTAEGRQAFTKILMQEERARFVELQREFINQIDDVVMREAMEQALRRMEAIDGR